AVAVDDDLGAVLFLDADGVQEPDDARVLGDVAGGLGDAGRTTVVERPHGELRARLADRLRGDDADRLADVDEIAGGKVAAVALPADTAPWFAGENRADLDALDARFLDVARE